MPLDEWLLLIDDILESIVREVSELDLIEDDDRTIRRVSVLKKERDNQNARVMRATDLLVTPW